MVINAIPLKYLRFGDVWHRIMTPRMGYSIAQQGVEKMMMIAATLMFLCYTLVGLFILAVSPLFFGLPFLSGCVGMGLWVSTRMVRAQVQPI